MGAGQPHERIVVAQLDLDPCEVASTAHAGRHDDRSVATALDVAEGDVQRHHRARPTAAHDHAAVDPPQLALVAVPVPHERPQLLWEAPIQAAAHACGRDIDDDRGHTQAGAQAQAGGLGDDHLRVGPDR